MDPRKGSRECDLVPRDPRRADRSRGPPLLPRRGRPSAPGRRRGRARRRARGRRRGDVRSAPHLGSTSLAPRETASVYECRELLRLHIKSFGRENQNNPIIRRIDDDENKIR